ncbi:hypothetical protein JL721_9680 [Aureococcus anophagefferens]|nr:hypothetical protein JL721_9680 [Aureococcus anophagefferens]
MWPRFNRVTYHILRWPILVVVYAFVFVELLFYCALRLFVAFAEFAVATPKHRELRHALRHSRTTRPRLRRRRRASAWDKVIQRRFNLFSATHTGDPKLVVTDFVEEIAASVRWLTAYALASNDAARVDGARARRGAREDLYDDAKLVRYLRCFDRSPWACVKSFLKTGHAYDGGEWMDIAKWFANDRPEGVLNMTFAEAYARSKKKLAITVHAKGKRAPPVLLTHLTSPHVTIVSAVVATAAVPLLIAPQVLLEKDPETGVVAPQAGGEAYIDGSIVHDIPTVGLKEAQRKVRRRVAGEPHFQPMLYSTHGAAGEPCRWSPSFGALSSEDAWRGGFVLAALELYLRTDMVNKLKFLADIDASPGWSGKMFAQSFEGTITITPRLAPVDYLNLFSNPTPGNIGRYTREGRVATYQKMAMLRTRLSVERALNEGCDAPAEARARPRPATTASGHGADPPRMALAARARSTGRRRRRSPPSRTSTRTRRRRFDDDGL